jgi:S1 RNA binding domain protein
MTTDIGNIVRGTVIKILDYGAIVRLDGGKAGLVHISEISDTFVRDVRDYFREDDTIMVKVLRFNKGRYELSVKQCKGASSEEKPAPAQPQPRPQSSARTARPVGAAVHMDEPSFEDRLSRFMKDSDERQHDLRRHLDNKRGKK